jgi:hypothetical protein
MNKIYYVIILLCCFSLFTKAQNSNKAKLPFLELTNLNPTLEALWNKDKNQFIATALQYENMRDPKIKTQAEYLFVISTDGLRWQEVFEGADSSLIACQSDKKKSEYLVKYHNTNPEKRRKLLMPFFWNTFAQKGQIFGNRNFDNNVTVTNRTQISYPGYAEIFCGFADDQHIHLNAKKQNPNITVLEWLNKQRGYRNKVAAFGSWELFPYIFNEKRAKFEVNAGFEKINNSKNLDFLETQKQLNNQLEKSKHPWKNHLRPDTLTWAFAKNNLEKLHPKVVFIGFGETDEYAHEGNYEGYLDATFQFDSLLSELWFLIQNDEKYRNKTAILITTDHGRGRNNWKSHNALNAGSDEIWLGIFSPDLQKTGENTQAVEIKQDQLASTMAALIGFNFEVENQKIATKVEILFNHKNGQEKIKINEFLSEMPLKSIGIKK